MAADDQAAMPSDDGIKREAERQMRDLSPAPLGDESIRHIQDICAGSAVPAGWIKINDQWDPMRCGNPTNIIYNVWTIARFDDRPVGSTMNVCAGAPTPAGWVDIGTRWDPMSCGHPNNIVQNVKQIKRLQ
jgi:hypothetical protein